MDKWINKKGWLDGYIDPIKRKEETLQEPTHGQGNVTVHVPLKCPGCRSRKVRCYGADRPVLYYKCTDCMLKFKVIEKEDH